ncbi:MAG: tandem-95 repeat protein [Armatimonadetes bacterium]|nr:tandem-95 repeat protein [Armatimonadota bacterium]
MDAHTEEHGRPHRLCWLLLLVALSCSAGAQPAPRVPRFHVISLGTLGGARSYARGINATGQVVGEALRADGKPRAFLFSGNGPMQDLGTLGGLTSYACAINDSGQVVGRSGAIPSTPPPLDYFHAFRYDGSMHDLEGSLPGASGCASGINAAGQVVGWRYVSNPSRSQAFLYDGSIHDLGVLTGLTNSHALGINSAGCVVGYSDGDQGRASRPFLYDGHMHDLGTLGGRHGRACGINATGVVVGYADRADGRHHAFLYDGSMHDLGTLGGLWSDAYGINAVGQVVGSGDIVGGARHAFLYLDGAMHDLNALIPVGSGFSVLEVATGISDNGEICGIGTVDGHYRAFKLVPNEPPVAVADDYQTRKNTPLTITASGVLANDADDDASAWSEALTVAPDSQGTNLPTSRGGTVALSADGSFTYTPKREYVGDDTFTYRSSDGLEESNVATVKIAVNNRAPVAVDDRYLAYRNQSLNQSAVGVLANDTDDDGDALTVDPASLGTNLPTTQGGRITLNPDGSFSYSPKRGYVGDDTFAYRCADEVEGSGTATVTIAVTDRAPAARDDHYSAYKNRTLNQLTRGVLANDADPDGDELSVAVVSQGTSVFSTQGGKVTLGADGSFRYSPRTGYSGDDAFTYRCSDGVKTSGVARVKITVRAQPW